MSVLSIDKTILLSITNIDFLAITCFMFNNGNVKHKCTNYGTILRPEEFCRDVRTQTRNKGQSRKIRDLYKWYCGALKQNLCSLIPHIPPSKIFLSSFFLERLRSCFGITGSSEIQQLFMSVHMDRVCKTVLILSKPALFNSVYTCILFTTFFFIII
jgi:hypothetical protein